MAKPRRTSRTAHNAGRRWSRWVVATLLGALVVGVTVVIVIQNGVSWRDRVPIVEATLTGPHQLEVVVGTCRAEPELDLLKEQDQRVEVAVVSTRKIGGWGGLDCQDLVEVSLQAPLGDRLLIDATTGDEVTVDIVPRRD